MKKLPILAAISLLSSAVHASPVFFKCQTGEGDAETKFKVLVDEETGKIAHTYEDGASFNSEGTFTQDKITYQITDLLSEVTAVRQYEISRSDLSLKEHTEKSIPKFADSIPAEQVYSDGKCEIIEAPKN